MMEFSNIYDGIPSQMFDGVLNTPLNMQTALLHVLNIAAKGLNMSLERNYLHIKVKYCLV